MAYLRANLEFIRCGIGSNYGGKFYEDKMQQHYLPGTKLLNLCPHGQGITDYCQPCGRVNGGGG